MKKNLLDNLDNINIDDIVINCTKCNNRVVLFQNACGACLSPEFWKGSPLEFRIRYKRELASVKTQTCEDFGYADSYYSWVRKGRRDINSKTDRQSKINQRKREISEYSKRVYSRGEKTHRKSETDYYFPESIG